MKKIKILTLGDHPFTASGVGIQSRYTIEGLLETGKYSVVSLGGATNTQNKTPVVTEKWGDDWKIFPVGNNGKPEEYFGTPEIVRSVLRTEKPDMLWIMTDPKWYKWLWQIEDEIRPLVPIVYYHVWDNYPVPYFNRNAYLSNDAIVSISKLTHDVVNKVTPELDNYYLPHTVDTEVFTKIDTQQVKEFKKNSLGSEDRFVFFWNNRNARRKMSASVLWWFSDFAKSVGKDNVCLIMHTDPQDPYGADLSHLLSACDATEGEILISSAKYLPNELAMIYNMADCTINISDAEGFGMATLESLACETPIIVNMTGGLQEQVTDGDKWFGLGIEPASKALNSSHGVPYIYEDRVSKESFMKSLKAMYDMPTKERTTMGKLGREHVLTNYGFEKFHKEWDRILTEVYEKNGSWENRKNYNCWSVEEL
jgi:glycosyltransferase involved in cell wall biosynthesis